jgi:hypothetical protein
VPGREVRVAINASDRKHTVLLPSGDAGWSPGSGVRDALSGATASITGEGVRVRIEPRGAQIWVPANGGGTKDPEAR